MSGHSNQARALLDAWDVLLRHRKRFIVPAFLVTELTEALAIAVVILVPFVLADLVVGAGLVVEVRSHFFGCATSLVGVKPI